MIRAILFVVVLDFLIISGFAVYTEGLVEGVKMSHRHLPPPSDIGF